MSWLVNRHNFQVQVDEDLITVTADAEPGGKPLSLGLFNSGSKNLEVCLDDRNPSWWSFFVKQCQTASHEERRLIDLVVDNPDLFGDPICYTFPKSTEEGVIRTLIDRAGAVDWCETSKVEYRNHSSRGFSKSWFIEMGDGRVVLASGIFVATFLEGSIFCYGPDDRWLRDMRTGLDYDRLQLAVDEVAAEWLRERVGDRLVDGYMFAQRMSA